MRGDEETAVEQVEQNFEPSVKTEVGHGERIVETNQFICCRRWFRSRELTRWRLLEPPAREVRFSATSAPASASMASRRSVSNGASLDRACHSLYRYWQSSSSGGRQVCFSRWPAQNR